MIPKHKTFILLLSAMSCVLLIRCTKAPLAGDVTETGNATVAGLILDTKQYPARNTVVRLIPENYDPVKDAALPETLSDTTDQYGRFSISTKRSGKFNIIASCDKDTTGAFVKCVELRPDDTTQSPTGFLTHCGAISVQNPLNADSTSGYIYIQGSPFFNRLDHNPVVPVIVSNIPACTTTSVYYSEQSEAGTTVLMAKCVVTKAHDTVEITRLNRGENLLIGIDDQTKSYDVLKRNKSLFSFQVGYSNNNAGLGGNYSRIHMPFILTKISQSDSLGLRPAFALQGFSETSFDSIKNQFTDNYFMANYYRSYIEAMTALKGKNAVIILEPYTLAFYAQRANLYPATCLPGMEPVMVNNCGIVENQNFANTFVGFIQALVHHTHSIAPDATIGFYLVNWALYTSNSAQELVYWPKADQTANVDAWKGFLDQLSVMNDIDFLSFGKAKTDAGLTGQSSSYWTSVQLTSYLSYCNMLHQKFNKPLVGWLLPIGHMGLPNTQFRYEDTFVEYFFANRQSFSDAGFTAMLFGKNNPSGTDLSDSAGIGDDGWFINKLKNQN